MGKRVTLINEMVFDGVTVPKDTIGEIVDYPGFDNGQFANKPEIEHGQVKVSFTIAGPITVVATFAIDKMALYLADADVTSES